MGSNERSKVDADVPKPTTKINRHLPKESHLPPPSCQHNRQQIHHCPRTSNKMPQNTPDRGGRRKKSDADDWVKVPKDPEWQEDIDEHDKIYSGPGADIKKSTLKSTSFGSLLKEFCAKVMDTSSRASGMTRRAGGSRAGKP